jgi:2-dehydro-3-deoxyphosphogluconate aldolase/(4S)-4-hydroxy-2-oxoglutarate aldolase
MTSTLKRIQATGVIAVVRLDDLSQAVNLSRALVAGGVNIIEFTLTTPNAAGAIRRVRGILSTETVIIGAGSVITPEQVAEVADCGAQFVVSPVTKQSVITACQQYHVPVIPGAFTPTEIQTAWEMGADAVKVFPARQMGARYIRDVLAPLPHLKLIPTGGINSETIGDYVRAGVLAAGVGGALCDVDAIQRGDWATITAEARKLTDAVQDARS